MEIPKLNYKDGGLIPAIVQDAKTGEVLMIAYMNEEAVRRTLESGEVWFWSRSRQEYWLKGETSGNKLYVKSIWEDCDQDALLVVAEPVGPVCHTGNRTCFFKELTGKNLKPVCPPR